MAIASTIEANRYLIGCISVIEVDGIEADGN